MTARLRPRRLPGARRRLRASLPRRVARVATTDSLLRVLDLVIDAMQRPGLRGGAIFLINERNELYFGAHRGLADDSVRDIRLPVGQGIVGRVAAEGRGVVVDDLDAPPPGVTPSNRQRGSNRLSRSMIAVPIKAGDGVLGVLQMGCTRSHAFDDSDRALLERTAAAMATAVAHANPVKLADEVLRRRVRELTALQEAARALNASLGLDLVLPAVAQHAALAVRTPCAVVVSVEPDGSVRVVAKQEREMAAAHADVDLLTTALRDSLPVVIPGVAHSVALTVSDDHAPPPTDPQAPLRSAAMVQLRSAGGLAIAMAVGSVDERGFDPAQLRLLEGIADLATLAIANAVRYRKLEEAAATDPLTGLLRRSDFEHALAATAGETVSVVVVDVDHFKQVNDSAGHEAGDRALAAIAHSLHERIGGLGTLARTGGDEFGLLLPGVHHATAIAVAEELRRSVAATPLVIPWLPRVSVGLATAAADADPRSAWDAAVEALAHAKRWGRDRVESSRAVAGRVAPRVSSEALLPHLFEPGRITARYAPVVHLADSALAGFEAVPSVVGFAPGVETAELFAAARGAGLHRDLDWACRRAALYGAAGMQPGLPLFVNISVWALIDPLHDVDQMLLLLRSAGLAAADVVLELSEREAVHDLDRLRAVLAAYRAQGFRFSIDDVGEGHSTLDMLAAGSPEFIKIAGSLVAGQDRPGARAAVEAVVAFARSAGAVVVADGLASAAQAGRVAAMGVTLGQGRWLGPAVTLGRVDAAQALELSEGVSLLVG